jgi:tetratricopeptide (TPR) repeat protein
VLQRIKAALPEYVDAALRLSGMARQRGHFSEAEELLKEAIGQHPEHPDAWIMYGNLELDRGALKPAESKFKRVIKDLGLVHDPYARLALVRIREPEARPGLCTHPLAPGSQANISFSEAQSLTPSASDPKRREKAEAKDKALSAALGVR